MLGRVCESACFQSVRLTIIMHRITHGGIDLAAGVPVALRSSLTGRRRRRFNHGVDI